MLFFLNNDENETNNVIMCSDTCRGWLGAFVAILGFGTFGVPIKSQAANSVNVDPVVMQTYKSTMCFLWAILLIVIPSDTILGLPKPSLQNYTPWGILSGLFWVPGGVAVVYSIRNAGLALTVGINSSLIVLVSFTWGIFVFEEQVKSVFGACLAVILMLSGIVGMSYYSDPHRQNTRQQQVRQRQSMPLVSSASSAISQQSEGDDNDDDDDDDDELNVSLKSMSEEKGATVAAISSTETTYVTESSHLTNRYALASSSMTPDSQDGIASTVELQQPENTTMTFVQVDQDENDHDVSSDEDNDDFDNSNDIVSRSKRRRQRRRRRRRNQMNNDMMTSAQHITIAAEEECDSTIELNPLEEIQIFGGRRMTRRQLGICCSMFNGLWGGSIMVPMHFAPPGTGGIGYTFSFAVGAMIVTIGLWLLRWMYEIYIHKGQIRIAYHSLPSMHVTTLWWAGGWCGTFWSIANIGSMISVEFLGEGLGYSTCQAALMVSGLWGIFWFREIRGCYTISMWLVSACLTITSLILLSYQHV